MSTTTRRPLAWHQHLARTAAGLLCLGAFVLLIGFGNALGDLAMKAAL